MARLLFLCDRNDSRSLMAEAFALARHEKDLTVESAGLVGSAVHAMAVKVMGEAGIDVSRKKSQALGGLKPQEFDVVITMSPQTAAECPLLPGHPQMVNWIVDDPDAVKGDEATVLGTFRHCRDVIKVLVENFFKMGYLNALLSARRSENLILNSISDGILAHDLRRRIIYFNRAAETITGYTWREVIDRDCHDVFDGGLCGGKCLLPDGGPLAVKEVSREPLQITAKDGSVVLIERTIRSLRDATGEAIGLLVAFHDLTREKQLARQVRETQSFAGLIGRDEKMLEVYDLIRDLALTDVPVLVQGESGTGKELVAAAMHNEGPRAGKLFVPVNCGALPETLLESELFGHVRGAFTGAVRDKKGRFELADGGTIFLDEIGDISPAMQIKLLRVLQEGSFERVGDEVTRKVNVRVVSATNKNLADEIAAGRFREDLFYRLSVVPLWLPALRERRNDIPLLARHVLKMATEAVGRLNMSISPEAMNVMLSYEWPGNVRELQNWIQYALVKCKGSVIMPEHLPPTARVPTARDPDTRRRKIDVESVRLALSRTGGNKMKAAELLGVSRATLYRFIDDIGGI